MDLECGESTDLECVFLGLPPGGSFTHYASQADADAGFPALSSSPLSNIVSSRKVFTRYEITGGCFATECITITVNHPTTELTTQDLTIDAACSGGSGVVDLASGIVSQMTLSSGAVLTTFHTNLTDATNGTNALSSTCLLYTSPSPRDLSTSRMPSSA